MNKLNLIIVNLKIQYIKLCNFLCKYYVLLILWHIYREKEVRINTLGHGPSYVLVVVM